MRPESDDLRAVDVNWLKREGLFVEEAATRLCAWTDGSSINVTGGSDRIRLSYRVSGRHVEPRWVEQVVGLEWTPCNFGGKRPWFRCPSCSRRVGKLYGGARFVCRHCCGMVYSSTLESPPFRLLRRAQNLRVRCGGSPNTTEPFPEKPAGMSWRTYWRLREESQRAAHESLAAAARRRFTIVAWCSASASVRSQAAGRSGGTVLTGDWWVRFPCLGEVGGLALAVSEAPAAAVDVPERRSWLPLGILGAAQFVMVLDSSVMNVSISQIVHDLHTTIQGVQTAITMYTLVMAAFMLVGAKLGDMYGRDRIFAIGLAVYACGSLTTALSPNLAVLLFGWSLVEGIGAVMVIPAIAALIASNYVGKQRALAYGVIGGVAGAAIAAGPLIGGWVTTELSWRYVFAGEVLIVVAVLLFRRRMTPAPPSEHRPQLDVVGAALSAIGLGLAVFGILMSSTWGWVKPKQPPTIGGHALTPFGFSPVPFLIFGGLVFMVLFKSWEERRERQGKDVLLQRGLARIPTLSAGLETLGMMQLVLLGTFFVLPVYLQVVLGFDAFDTGKRLFPMSVSMLIAALAGPRLAGRFAPKWVCQAGLGAMTLAALVLMGTIDVTLHGTAFALSLILFGIGAGLLMSQVGNVIMSSAPPESANEAGGLQGTAQNLGASLGTALIGAILLTSLTASFVSRVSENPALPQDVRTSITTQAEKGIDIVPVDQVHQAALAAGLPPDQADALATDYGNAQLDGLKRALLGVALLAAAGLYFTRGLPPKALTPTTAT